MSDTFDTPSSAPQVEQDAKLILVSQMALRVERIEKLLSERSSTKTESTWYTDLLKHILGSWPMFGFIFLALFYGPLQSAITAIAKKFDNAQVIEVAGLSLKSIIETNAEKSNPGLSAVLPTLSPTAIAVLIQGQKDYGSTIASYGTSDPKSPAMWLPTEALLMSIEELERANLAIVDVQYDEKQFVGVVAARNAVADFKSKNPGRLGYLSEDQFTWLSNKLPPIGIDLRIGWKQTKLGREATSLIVNSIAEELARNRHDPKIYKKN